jgi:surface antigen
LRSLLRLTALIGAFAVGGCSYQLGSVTPKSAADVEQTGALGSPAQQAEGTTPPPEIDLAYARAAAAEAVARGRKDDSVPWSNPNTGASGNITPLATSYGEGTCRDFLASYVRGETEAWLQGEACRTGRGKWEVKSLTPLNRD